MAQARIYRVWNVADYASPDTDYLQMLGEVLAGDKNSRLYKRLVIDEQLATRVDAGLDSREIGSQFMITADAKPGADVARIEQVIDEELRKVIAGGPNAAELAKVRTTSLAGFARNLESISSKASQLAESTTYLGSPDAWKPGFDRLKTATPADIQRVGRTWLSDGDYNLQILPFGDLAASAVGADRSKMPMPEGVAMARFPSVERATLANGMKLVVARRPGVPVIGMTMLVNTGTPADWQSVTAGTGGIAMDLLDEGTTSRSRQQITEQLGALGAKLGTNGGGETSSVSLSALKPALKPSLDLYADVVMHPAFAQSELDRLKTQSLAGLAAARQDPGRMAGRVLPAVVFGPDNAYGRMVTEASIRSIDRGAVSAFHQRWFHPGNATLIVTGDASLAEIRPQVEAAFAGWQQAAAPATIVPTAQPPAKSVIYLIDKPGAAQSVVQAALVAPPRKEGDEIARDAFNTALGGGFTSRLNMKLREEKGWAYGARSGIGGGRGARLFTAGSSVQADKTAETVTEIAALLKGVTSDRRIDAAELANAKDTMSLGLSSDWSTGDGIAQYLADQVASDLPEDYYGRYPQMISAASLDAVNGVGDTLISNRAITWVVVGERATLEGKLRALGIGEVRVVDADGKPAG